LWAEFCSPNENWSDEAKLKKLYTSNFKVCSKHFKAEDYEEHNSARLRLFCIPSLFPVTLTAASQPFTEPMDSTVADSSEKMEATANKMTEDLEEYSSGINSPMDVVENAAITSTPKSSKVCYVVPCTFIE